MHVIRCSFLMIAMLALLVAGDWGTAAEKPAPSDQACINDDLKKHIDQFPELKELAGKIDPDAWMWAMHLHYLGEQSMVGLKVEPGDGVFRVLQVDAGATCSTLVRIEKVGDSVRLMHSSFNAQGIFSDEKLAPMQQRESRNSNLTQWTKWLKTLDKAEYWNAQPTPDQISLDGTRVMIEGVVHGKVLKIVVRPVTANDPIVKAATTALKWSGAAASKLTPDIKDAGTAAIAPATTQKGAESTNAADHPQD